MPFKSFCSPSFLSFFVTCLFCPSSLQTNQNQKPQYQKYIRIHPLETGNRLDGDDSFTCQVQAPACNAILISTCLRTNPVVTVMMVLALRFTEQISFESQSMSTWLALKECHFVEAILTYSSSSIISSTSSRSRIRSRIWRRSRCEWAGSLPMPALGPLEQ